MIISAMSENGLLLNLAVGVGHGHVVVLPSSQEAEVGHAVQDGRGRVSIKFRLCQNSSRDGEAVLPVGHVEGGDGRVVGDLQRASLDRGLDVTRKLPVLQDRMFCCHFYDPSNIEMFPQ